MPREECYGVIVIYKTVSGVEFLLVKEQKFTQYSWGFSKGHIEIGENPQTVALRELKEETGITEISLLDSPLLSEEYEVQRLEGKRIKINKFFMGFVSHKEVNIDPVEIADYRWVTYEEALDLLESYSRKNILQQAKEFLDTMVK